MTFDKRASLFSTLVVPVIGVAVGILLLIFSSHDEWTETILHVSFIVLGALVVIVSIPSLIAGILSINTTYGRILTVFSAVSVILGILIIFLHNEFFKYIVAVYIIAVPVVSILISTEKRTVRLKRELPKIIIGIILLIIGFADMLSLLITIAGWVAIVFSIAYFVFGMINQFLMASSDDKR